MAQPREPFEQQLVSRLSRMAVAGIYHAARGMSGMIGKPMTVCKPRVRLVALMDIPDLLGGAESEAACIYLQSERALSGQMMMVIPYAKALELVDLLLGNPAGSTLTLGRLECSALAELGNVTCTSFLNAVADITGLEGRPTPPAVAVDMIGAILDILLASWDGLSDEVLTIEATFQHSGEEAGASFWIIPNQRLLEAVGRREYRIDGLAQAD